MPTLTNERYELFAQELAKGKNATEAYVTAGYRANAGNACVLKADQRISKRISELLEERDKIHSLATQKAAEALSINREWVMGQLKENAQRAMQAVAVLDGEGEPTGEYRYEGNVANRALELLGKEIGMFVDRSETKTVVHTVSDEPLTPEQWAVEHRTEH